MPKPQPSQPADVLGALGNAAAMGPPRELVERVEETAYWLEESHYPRLAANVREACERVKAQHVYLMALDGVCNRLAGALGLSREGLAEVFRDQVAKMAARARPADPVAADWSPDPECPPDDEDLN
jgi:hypothetical protein